jgi:hypothetical protein
MDPVSRQLAAAAMGLVFALSREDELEKMRLDLERARMEREDFRNGGGPDTYIMHDAPVKGLQDYYARAYKYHMRPIVEYQQTTRKALKHSTAICDGLEEQLLMATQVLARIARYGPRKRKVAISALDDLGLDSNDVERAANDGQGVMELGMALDYEEHPDQY